MKENEEGGKVGRREWQEGGTAGTEEMKGEKNKKKRGELKVK